MDPSTGQELQRLRAESAFLRSVLRHAGDVIVATDLEGRITEWSGGAEKVLGYAREEVLGRPATSFYVDPETRAALIERLRSRGDDPLIDQEVQVRRKDGRKLWLSLTLAQLLDPGGRRIGTVGVSKDVTERKRLERELRRLSTTDKLTGLYNQAHFFHRLEVEKERASRLQHGLVLTLFDLDRFKDENDLHGHEAGDRLLRSVGNVVFQSIRKEVDAGFRYGGDEFCVLLPGTTVDGALVFCERVRAAIEAGNQAGVTPSMGIAAFDPDDASQKLVQQADLAMYRAKRMGGNRICIHGRPGVAWRGGRQLHAPEPHDVAERAAATAVAR
jgi:diguanylate cyclase (GGDEF)-like protein/PAS domain S-box-containing protein